MARRRSLRYDHHLRRIVLIAFAALALSGSATAQPGLFQTGYGISIRYTAGRILFSFDSSSVRASSFLTPTLDSLVSRVLALRIRDSISAAFTVGPRLLNPALVAPSGTNGWVLTTSGGVATWAAAAGGSGDTSRLWPAGTTRSYWGIVSLTGDFAVIGKGRVTAPDSSIKSAIVNKTMLDSMIIRELVFGREFTVSDTNSTQAFGIGGSTGASGIPVVGEGLVTGASWVVSNAGGSITDANYIKIGATSSYSTVGIRGADFLIRVMYYRTVGASLRRFEVQTTSRTGAGGWTTRITIPVHAIDLTDPTFTGQAVVSVHLRRRYANDTYL